MSTKLKLELTVRDHVCYWSRPGGISKVIEAISRKDDDVYMIEVYPRQEEKTLQQLRAFHGPIRHAIKDHTGQNVHRIKQDLKVMFGIIEEQYTGLDGVERTRYKSLGEYTLPEMNLFLEDVIHWCIDTLGFTFDFDAKKIIYVA